MFYFSKMDHGRRKFLNGLLKETAKKLESKSFLDDEYNQVKIRRHFALRWY